MVHIKKQLVIMIGILFILTMTGCMNTSGDSVIEESVDNYTSALDSNSSTGVEEIENGTELRNPENFDGETKPCESDKSILYFTPSSFFFGSTINELKATFFDIEKIEPYANPVVYYSKEADISFFGWTDDGGTSEERIRIREIRAPAKIVFPHMGERILKSEIEDIIGEDLHIEMYGEMVAHFSYQGGIFTYSVEDSCDLLPETSLLVVYTG